MFFLKKLWGANPEKLEQRGDAYFSRKSWGAAKLEYERALEALSGGKGADGASIRRLQGKLGKSNEALARDHLQTGDVLTSQGFDDDARELFQLARELTRDPHLDDHLARKLDEGPPADGIHDGSEPAITEKATPGDLKAPEGESLDDLFEALCGTLPEAVQHAYASYGVFFKSGYLALNRGDFQRAVEDLTQAMEQNPSPKSYVPLELANAFMNVGRLAEARNLLQEFLTHAPGWPCSRLPTPLRGFSGSRALPGRPKPCWSTAPRH